MCSQKRKVSILNKSMSQFSFPKLLTYLPPGPAPMIQYCVELAREQKTTTIRNSVMKIKFRGVSDHSISVD